MRENLDMGRPDHVQLIFNRRVSRRTPTRHRSRVITDGVIPSLHVDCKHSPAGFRNRELREAAAPLRGMSLDDYNAGQMTYELRRRRLRGLIERIPRSQRYRLTAEGLCIAPAC